MRNKSNYCFFVVLFMGLIACNANAQIFLPVTQTINGTVYRAGTDTVIADASVYYGGSMNGTITGKDGKFQLIAKSQQIPVTVSCIGYYSATVNYQPGVPLIVYLKPKAEELLTVTIRANALAPRKDGMKRKDEELLFISEFIGTSDRALECTITNMADIKLFYDRKTDKLTASCNVPIIIKNKALGYTISYYLDRFEKTPQKTAFAGNYIFKENKFAGIDTVIKERKKAYIASRMHFIRSLWRHTIKQDGYKILSAKYTPLTEDNIASKDSTGYKYLLLIDGLVIVHNSSPFVLNYLSTKGDVTFIDESGYYGLGLLWSGGMGRQRIGDLLPYEYQPTDEPRQITKQQAIIKE